MGVDLNVWSNHKLRFNSYEEGIDEFERMTSKKIRQWDLKKDEPLKKTRNVSEVEYFTHFEVLNQNFENYNEIKIWTNFEFCHWLTLLKQTLKIHPTGFRIRYSKWQELVTENYGSDDEAELEKMKESRKNWIQFREYAHTLTKSLGGDKVIYLNDHTFQNEEGLFFQGKSLSEGINSLNSLNETVEPCELELFKLFPNDIRAKTAWYYDELGKEN
ncbi:MAG: hypothetical protein R2825_01270 [Saprospiraceae bacterium]